MSAKLRIASSLSSISDFETRSTRIATEVSEDISKAFSRALKPPEPEPGSDEAQRPIASPHYGVWELTEDQQTASRFKKKGEWIRVQPRLELVRQSRNG